MSNRGALIRYSEFLLGGVTKIFLRAFQSVRVVPYITYVHQEASAILGSARGEVVDLGGEMTCVEVIVE